MAVRTCFTCQQCGHQAPKWLGRCPSCGTWASMVEEPAEGGVGHVTGTVAAAPCPYPEVPIADAQRTSTGLAELDRVLGGGLVPGAVALIGGEPGIGKSTLLLQATSAMADSGRRVLYVTGEESAAQLRLRGQRLGVSSTDLLILAETDVEAIAQASRQAAPALVVIDSIQAVRCAEMGSLPGSVGQVRESAGRLVTFAKATLTPVILVGHVTKEGSLAGPRVLEHVVDAVLQFEGDHHHAHRILRALKNRFGPADELGVFTMTDTGLRGVASPSEMFLAERSACTPGSAVLAAVEGSRPLLVEIQALVGEPVQGSPRRTTLGIDAGRIAMILAVLQRRTALDVAQRDVFVNVTGGISVSEPAADLAVAVAAASSAVGRAVPEGWVVTGEIGLTGEIRSVARTEARLREAVRLGFTAALLPAGGREPRIPRGLTAPGVHNVAEALTVLSMVEPLTAPHGG